MIRYLLDANVLIEAHKGHYPFDFCYAFWDWLHLQNESGRVFSITNVKNEIEIGDDALVEWVKLHPRFFLDIDGESIANMNAIADYVKKNEKFQVSGKRKFLSGADGFLVAFARAHGYCVVTHEKTNQHRPKIPDICSSFGVRAISPFEMLRQEKAQFILQK